MSPNDPSPNDVLMVANLDVDCSDTTQDVVKVSNRIKDDEGNVSTQVFDKFEEWNHADYFQVKFDGKPYRVAPGKTMMLPRFIAEHFAKHLADHLLTKKENATSRRGLVQSPVERPKLLSEILVEVNSPQPVETDPLLSPIDTSPDVGGVEDAGVVVNATVGVLKDEPPTLEELYKLAGEPVDKEEKVPIEETSITDPDKPQPTRRQLIQLCYDQNIDITGKENKAELIELLKRG